MTEKRLETIDVFRGLAILLVVLFHFTARLPPETLNVSGTPAPRVFFGWVGVYFFFAISGYCIYLTLEKSATVSLFLARRFSRLYPAFLAAAILLFAYDLVSPVPSVPSASFHEAPVSLFDLLTNLIFLDDGRWVNGSFWSIAVEVKFYLVLGLLALAIPDRRKLATVFTYLSLAAAPLWMAAMLIGSGDGSQLPQKLLKLITIGLYLPFFAFGILAYMRMRKAMPTALLLLLCALEAAIVVAWDGPPDANAALISVAVTLGLMGLLVLLSDGRRIPHIPYLSTGLAKIGFVSFSWYLLHENLGVSFLFNLDRFMPASVAVFVALLATLLIAYVFSVLFEWRFRKPFERLALMVLDGFGRLFARVRLASKLPSAKANRP